ncbi:MAG TPA: hypothetical protein VNK67_10105 [Burkholderiales bacterium]|nr:hypothetical protein [Burkholderiales bacterium]
MRSDPGKAVGASAMRCAALAGILLLAISFRAPAQEPDAADLRKALADTPANTFRYFGGQLVCKQDKPAPDYLACLRIGELRVGEPYRPVRERNPRPWREVALEGGVTASAFLIESPPGTHAYWVIGHRDDTIVSVQLTGNYPHPDFHFATVRLDDSEEKVLSRLGPSSRIHEVKEIGGLLWDYSPLPFSIEFVRGRVYSIRVALPERPR